MTRQKSYAGIDIFRFIFALMIVAIHTSPLSSSSEIGDFIFTRIISRVAVPFFFMTSGFFLISKYTYNNEKLTSFIKKTSIIYAVVIILYIPINIYNGYFKADHLLHEIIKDIVFDGTLYHLWYLPASIIGAVIAWYSLKYFHYKKALFIASLLYIIGLFGDSCYGIIEGIPYIKSLYELIFQVSDYTRNGIFFAPIFFLLGGYIADSNRCISLKRSVSRFVLFFSLMLTEALILYCLKLQRHDSMYVFLLPVMYYLFNIILHFKGKRHARLRTISLIIYIIHPFVIIIVRFVAKSLHLQHIFIKNSMIHYLTVCFISVICSLILTTMQKKIKPKTEKHDSSMDRAYLEIDLNNLEHNVMTLQNAMIPGCKMMAVVKADAYGHGMYEITTYLEQLGVSSFAVATIDEGIRMRKYGICGEILILGYTSPSRAKELYIYKLTQTLIDYDHASKLNDQGYNINCHIKIDTGMHRLGFEVNDYEKIRSVFSMEHIHTTGIFTHLCVSDSLEEGDIEFTHKQIDSFYGLIDELKSDGLHMPKIHIQSSYGLLNYPELKCDYVRVGIALYGVLSSPNDKTRLQLDLKPVLSLKASVVLLRDIKEGEAVGYNRAFTALRNSKVAVLPIGYADGIPRKLSCGNGYALVNGQRAPIIGKICMDQLSVDVTDIPNVTLGSVATLIGSDGKEELSAPIIAENAESITNEFLSRMGKRLRIVCKTADQKNIPMP